MPEHPATLATPGPIAKPPGQPVARTNVSAQLGQDCSANAGKPPATFVLENPAIPGPIAKPRQPVAPEKASAQFGQNHFANAGKPPSTFVLEDGTEWTLLPDTAQYGSDATVRNLFVTYFVLLKRPIVSIIQ